MTFRNSQLPLGMVFSLAAAAILSATAQAATVPFVEDFATDAAGWHNGAGTAPVDWSGAGGPDGGAHVFTTLSLAAASEGDTPVLFRAQDKWGSSGGAFEGNWIADGVVRFSFFVRHDAPFPLTFFTRFSSPFNFPGAIAVHFVPVFPGVWTRIDIDIDPANPQFVSFEGTDFNTVFGNIGHVQIGISVAAGQAGFPAPIRIQLDKVELADCVPDCEGKDCGSDGCGGSCGTCEPGFECGADATCHVEAVPTVSTWGLLILTLGLAVVARLKFGAPPGTPKLN